MLTFLINRARRHWHVLSTVLFGVLISTAFLASGPIIVNTVIDFALTHKLRSSLNENGIIYLTTYNNFGEQEHNQINNKSLELLTTNLGELVEENVEIPLRLVKTPRDERNVRVSEVLKLVSLDHRAKHRTYELSGGKQQRVAISRALVNRSSIVLADEPTGQLDSNTGATIIRLLHEIAEQFGVTVIVASHDPNMVPFADKIIELKDGQIINLIDQNEISHNGEINNQYENQG